ncbi:hypothetical protein MesoLj131a_46890 [Mesorhizobium sp. 131-2-1]|nr:hypothetical protein MesoLj131a_46890 [Mesorhizobium sp. 131-2-1]
MHLPARSSDTFKPTSAVGYKAFLTGLSACFSADRDRYRHPIPDRRKPRSARLMINQSRMSEVNKHLI